MRNIFMRSTTTILVSAVIFFAAAPTILCSPTIIPMSELGKIASQYVDDLRSKNKTEDIRITLWMHKGDPKMNGCGFYFKVTGYSDKISSAHFPNYTKHVCGHETYEMRMTSPSTMYDKPIISFDNEQVSEIEIHADGYSDTNVDVMCFGLNERIITGRAGGGPRGFCINNDLLKACKNLRKTWDKINIDREDITLTRTNRGVHKIVFRDIENLIGSLEKLYRNSRNINALSKVCDRIELVRGTFSHEHMDCPAQRTWTTSNASEIYENEDKNPYGCEPYAGI